MGTDSELRVPAVLVTGVTPATRQRTAFQLAGLPAYPGAGR
jgi:hypothetical protein